MVFHVKTSTATYQVVVDNQEVFDLVKEDPILKDKVEHYTSE